MKAYSETISVWVSKNCAATHAGTFHGGSRWAGRTAQIPISGHCPPKDRPQDITVDMSCWNLAWDDYDELAQDSGQHSGC